jgi:hypothetical protein
MALTADEKAALTRIHLFLGQSRSLTQELFESLATYIIMEHLNGRDIVIPYLGKLALTFQGDEIRKTGKQAVVETHLDLSSLILRSIGQVHDGEVLTDAHRLRLSHLSEIFEQHEKGTFGTGGDE